MPSVSTVDPLSTLAAVEEPVGLVRDSQNILPFGPLEWLRCDPGSSKSEAIEERLRGPMLGSKAVVLSGGNHAMGPRHVRRKAHRVRGVKGLADLHQYASFHSVSYCA